MAQRKRIKARGKIPMSRMFQTFNEGDSVSLVEELSVQGAGFPKRMQGVTGKVITKRGEAYVVEIKDLGRTKTLVVRPVHLKKLEVSK